MPYSPDRSIFNFGEILSRRSLRIGGLHRFHMSPAGAVHLFGTLIAGAVVFLLRAAMRKSRDSAIVQRTGFLLGGFAFAW